MEKADKKKYLKYIAASLEYGPVSYAKARVVFYFGIVSSPFFAVLAVLMAVSVAFGFLLFLIIPVLLLPLCFYLFLHAKKRKKKFASWLDDAAEYTAESKKIDSEFDLLALARVYRIQIKFDFEGAKIQRISGRPDHYEFDVYDVENGYHSVFRDFVDKEIRILYSPEYDQILILKENAPKFGTAGQDGEEEARDDEA